MKFILLKGLLLCCCGIVHAQRRTPLLEVEAAGGYQKADLRWSIAGAGSGQSPDILSELKWRGVSGPLVTAAVRLPLSGELFIGAEGSKCFIRTGTATDTDYADDDRRLPTYHAQLDSDAGSLSAFRLYAGYHFLQRMRMRMTVSAGYAENREALFLLDHAAYVPGQINLRCTYDTRWKGMAGGIAGRYQVTSWLDVTGEVLYSQVRYTALADWNLIAAFQHPVSFQQQASGFDVKAALRAVFRLKSYLSLFVSGAYRRAETGNGTDKLFLESGTVQTTRFNGAFTSAASVMMGTVIRF